MKLLPVLLLPILLCSCVTYSYRFEPTESGETLVQQYRDSLLVCTIQPVMSASDSPYARIDIERSGARSIVVKSLVADLAWEERRAAREGVVSYYIDPVTNYHIGPRSADSITMLDLSFRSLAESTGTRRLELEYHFGRLPHGLDKATFRIDLHLSVDGRPVRITRTLPLLIDTRSHWGTLRLAH